MVSAAGGGGGDATTVKTSAYESVNVLELCDDELNGFGQIGHIMELSVRDSSGLILRVGLDDQVVVPLKPSERVLCRQALVDALALLDQTAVTQSISSKEVAKDAGSRRTAPHLAYSRAVDG